MRPSASRSRFSNLTNACVLSPFAVYAGLIYGGDAIRYDHPDHPFTQEIELGLPHRFGIAIENGEEAYRNRGQETTFSIEGRYVLADWNKIPLNPMLFVEYRKGFGHIFHDKGVPMRRDNGADDDGGVDASTDRKTPRRVRKADDEDDADAGGWPRIPDAGEFRLLLAQDFKHKSEWGFAQSALVPVLLSGERLKVGVEMQYSSFTDKDTLGDSANRFVIGPMVAFKPTRNTRIDLSPLIGATFDAPRSQGFAVFSYTFGPGGASEGAEAPASTRNR